MNMKNYLVTLITLALLVSVIYSQVNTCHSSCGGNSSNDCSDYEQSTSSSSNCKTCYPGYKGGSPTGAPCVRGTCNAACVSCQDDSDQKCYLCAIGYYDPTNNPLSASPCSPCHSTCATCKTNGSDQCFICKNGYFDSSNNPYFVGTCDKCDNTCKTCELSSIRCTGGCNVGFAASNTIDVNNPTQGLTCRAK